MIQWHLVEGHISWDTPYFEERSDLPSPFSRPQPRNPSSAATSQDRHRTESSQEFADTTSRASFLSLQLSPSRGANTCPSSGWWVDATGKNITGWWLNISISQDVPGLSHASDGSIDKGDVTEATTLSIEVLVILCDQWHLSSWRICAIVFAVGISLGCPRPQPQALLPLMEGVPRCFPAIASRSSR